MPHMGEKTRENCVRNFVIGRTPDNFSAGAHQRHFKEEFASRVFSTPRITLQSCSLKRQRNLLP